MWATLSQDFFCHFADSLTWTVPIQLTNIIGADAKGGNAPTVPATTIATIHKVYIIDHVRSFSEQAMIEGMVVCLD